MSRVYKLKTTERVVKFTKKDKKTTLKKVEHNTKLRKTGRRGPTGYSTFVRAHHKDNPNLQRPDAIYVEWVGSVAPANGTEEDTWIDTSL